MTNLSPTPTWSPAGRTTTKRKKIMKDLVASIQNAPRSPRRIFKSFRSVGTNHKAAANTIELQADRNLTQFLTVDCPTDVLPKILAYAGPISAAALKQTSRHFRDVLNTEGTWRGLCEELYKWKPGEPEPSSWKQHYRRHPCVPVDFSCISTALAMAGAGWSKNQVKKRFNQKQQKSTCPILEIPESITVLVRPGKYEITEAIGISTMWRTTQVKIQRMQVPKGRVYVQPEEAKAESSLELKESDDESEETFLNDVIIESKTRRRNEPVIRVFRGQLVLDSIKLEHYSPGEFHVNDAIYLICMHGSQYISLIIIIIVWIFSRRRYLERKCSDSGATIGQYDSNSFHPVVCTGSVSCLEPSRCTLVFWTWCCRRRRRTRSFGRLSYPPLCCHRFVRWR